jgi:ferric-dicitrate binding protein FerR (iron transport regulator)
VGAYDATKDAAADAYERGLQGAYDAWEGTKDRSGQTWDAALDSFNWLFGLTSRSPEDALSSAWERWQATKAETGETWDEFKRKTLEQYEEGRKKWFQGADDRKGRSVRFRTFGLCILKNPNCIVALKIS